MGPGETGVSFSEAIARWTQFVAGSPLVVHDYYGLKRFLRAECKRESIGFDIAQYFRPKATANFDEPADGVEVAEPPFKIASGETMIRK